MPCACKVTLTRAREGWHITYAYTDKRRSR